MKNNNNNENFYNANNNSNPPPNNYIPPQFINNNFIPQVANLPQHYSVPSFKITGKLLQIDNRISTFNQYICLIWVLFTFSLFGIFSSILILTEFNESTNIDNISNRTIFEIINFFVNLFHLGGYFFSIQTFSKQQLPMQEKVELIFGFLGIINFIYFFFYIFLYHVFFLTWCMNIFFLVNNCVLYYQAKELKLIFRQKENVRRFENTSLDF